MTRDIGTIQHYKGIAETRDDYDYYIIDVWGVIHDGETPYPDAIHTLEQLKKANKTVFLLSNSSSRVSQLKHHMAAMGITPNLYDNALTAGELTYHVLCQQTEPWVKQLGSRFFYNGPLDRETLLEGLPYERVQDYQAADFLIVTGLFDATHSVNHYDAILRDCASRQIPLICANPDLKIVNMRGGQRACAGALAKQYIAFHGNVHFIGKPYSLIYQECLQQLGHPNHDRIVAIGDSLSTDIQGANQQNIESILVLNGVLKGEFTRMNELSSFCDQIKIWPTAFINQLIWSAYA